MDDLKLVSLIIYAIAFGAFAIFVGRALRTHGKVFLNHTFRDQTAIANSVDFLLILGFYILCAGLLLWNLGLEPHGVWDSDGLAEDVRRVFQTVALRLGVSIFVVGAFHSVNVLILSILNRNNRS